VKATLGGKTIKRKDVKYLQFDSIDIKLNFKDYSIMIENLFKKDQNLSTSTRALLLTETNNRFVFVFSPPVHVRADKAVNDLIKSQKPELRKLAMPMIEEVAGKMIINMINQILYNLPLDELFITE